MLFSGKVWQPSPLCKLLPLSCMQWCTHRSAYACVPNNPQHCTSAPLLRSVPTDGRSNTPKLLVPYSHVGYIWWLAGRLSNLTHLIGRAGWGVQSWQARACMHARLHAAGAGVGICTGVCAEDPAVFFALHVHGAWHWWRSQQGVVVMPAPAQYVCPSAAEY